jgi:hypothetical protein
MEFQMSFFKKLFATGSTVALLAGGALVPSSALAAAHGAGSVVKTPDGTVWFITSDNQRRAFTSGGAFMTYGFLSFAQVVDANTEDNGLTAGSFIAPRDGSIFCATMTKGTDVAGECSLITGGMKAAFTSASVFTGQGYSFARAQYGDSSFLTKTSNIDNAGAAHRQGALVNMSGTVYLVGTSTLLGIPSTEVFNSWGYSFADVVPANAADNAMTKSGVMCARVAGQLNPSFTAGSCASDNGDDNGPLNGGVGDITVSAKSTYSSESVGEGEEDVGVMAFDVEAGDDSDVQIQSVKVELKQTVTSNSRDIADYIDTVSVFEGSDKVAEVDASDFTENSHVFTKSVSLDSAIVRAGDTGNFWVAVTALNHLDSGDIDNDSFNVDVLNVRFVDGDGVTTTEDTDTSPVLDKTFDFESFASASDVELKAALTEGDDADLVNLAHVIDVDDSSDTNDEPILDFTLEAAGDSDVNVSQMSVNVDVSGPSNIDDAITNITLWHGDDQLASAASFGSGVGTDETYTFEDLDVDINAGDKEEFFVKVDFKSTGDVDLDNGDTITAQLSGTEVDLIEATDEAGDDVSTANLTGTAVGEASVVYDAGIVVSNITTDANRNVSQTPASVADSGEFIIEFDVTSFDANEYIDKSAIDGDANDGIDADDGNSAGQGVIYNVLKNGSASAPAATAYTAASAILSAPSKTGDTTTDFYIAEGTTRHFTLTVNFGLDFSGADASGNYQVNMTSVNWGTASNGTNAGYYTFDLTDSLTDPVFLDDYSL